MTKRGDLVTVSLPGDYGKPGQHLSFKTIC